MTPGRPTILSVEQAFHNARYIVPVYQRAYAWGEDQIATLLRDVHDYRERDHTRNYFIGSLVTYPRSRPEDPEAAYEVVDGQQRLTTLFIILATCAEEQGPALAGTLTFEGRSRSTEDLSRLASRGPSFDVDLLRDSGIKEAVETVRAARQRGEFTTADLRYLRTNTKLVRTTLPRGTDLNHYFEVMNSRGEQLEKHEIVKASLMGRIGGPEDGSAGRTFARIWDACADLGRHVQARFDTTARKEIFGDTWDDWRPERFADLDAALGGGSTDNPGRRTIAAILAESEPSGPAPTRDTTDATERYGAIIDFPNFLLHVLALTVGTDQRFSWHAPTPIPLDDKNLVETFKDRLRTPEEVQCFAFNLLKAKYLFDRYIIKTDRTRQSEDDSNWVLRRARKLQSGALSPIETFGPDEPGSDSDLAPGQNHVVLLQSMFQVTDPRRSYKNFLYAILEFLFENGRPDAEQFIDFLAGSAEQRYRANIDPGQLHQGTSVPHFAFNYLDYLLWRYRTEDLPEKTRNSFRFRYRSSVEHFYPQTPDPGSRIDPLDQQILDQFGNLCLMSRSENSRRSNLAPSAKIRQFRSDRQSLKFQLMAAATEAAQKAGSEWSQSHIEDHGELMIEILGKGVGGAEG